MIDLVGDPECKICYGSGVMPNCHWVEPCMKCHPPSDAEVRNGNIFFAVTIILVVTVIGLMKIFSW